MDPLKGWKIDLKSVYGPDWEPKQRSWNDFCLWESPDGTIAALFHHIIEVGVSKEIGRLAIFRNKEKPEMLFNFSNLECWYLYESGAQFGKVGLIFIHRFKDGTRRLGMKVCALDLDSSRFALVESIPENIYDIRHIDGKKYSFARNMNGTIEESTIDLDQLKWRALSNESNFYPDSFILEKMLRFMLPIRRRS